MTDEIDFMIRCWFMLTGDSDETLIPVYVPSGSHRAIRSMAPLQSTRGLCRKVAFPKRSLSRSVKEGDRLSYHNE